jgi:DNA polymerase III delta subunit
MKKKKLKSRIEYLQFLINDLNEDLYEMRKEVDRLEAEAIETKIKAFDLL